MQKLNINLNLMHCKSKTKLYAVVSNNRIPFGLLPIPLEVPVKFLVKYKFKNQARNCKLKS